MPQLCVHLRSLRANPVSHPVIAPVDADDTEPRVFRQHAGLVARRRRLSRPPVALL